MNYEVVKDIAPSPAELKIARGLAEMNIVFEQEVQFDECTNPDTGLHLRFDFYLPAQNILIEYDGVDYHTDTATKGRDRIKDQFAQRSNIRLIRVSGNAGIKQLLSVTLSRYKASPNNQDQVWRAKADPFTNKLLQSRKAKSDALRQRKRHNAEKRGDKTKW